MHQTTALPTNHADLVTDVAYDYYGERLATASADQKIKVWKKDPVKGSWDLEDEWKAHDAPVLQLAWSHPEHFNLLASCSYDRSVRIWEEVTLPSGGARPPPAAGHPTTQVPRKRWIECGLLMDARGSVRNIEFAPNAFGLKIATISTDSYLRIYTCLSPTLDDWQLSNTVSLPSLQSSQVAKEDTPRQPLIALGTPGPGLALTGSTSQSSVNAPNPGRGNEALGGWCLSWCKERWWGQVLAATSGHSGIIKLVTLSTPTPSALLVLQPPTTAPGNTSTSSNGTPNSSTAARGLGAQAITSLSWAPACGRSYHLVASGHRDGTVRIWKVWPPAAGASVGDLDGAGEAGGKAWRGQVAAEWGRGDVTVGKVEWNMTGSILSVASEDGKVRLFKATYAGDWQLYGTFSAEAPAEDTVDGEGDGRMQE